MLTLAPAYAAFQEKERGSIEVGKQADFTVFSADLMTIPRAEILKSARRHDHHRRRNRVLKRGPEMKSDRRLIANSSGAC